MGAVAAYMEYLREMARKIAYRGSFLKVIPGTKSMPSRYLDWDVSHSTDDMKRYLLAAEQDRQAKDGRALFLGVGFGFRFGLGLDLGRRLGFLGLRLRFGFRGRGLGRFCFGF